jgi:hypothetical protein
VRKLIGFGLIDNALAGELIHQPVHQASVI